MRINKIMKAGIIVMNEKYALKQEKSKQISILSKDYV